MSTREMINKQAKRKMNMQWLRNISGVVAAIVLAGHAWAQTAIQSITSGIQSGEVVVKVELSGPLGQEPQGFVVQNPARIALDLPGVVNGMDRSLVNLSQGNLRSVAVAQANDRTRLVLNLGSPTTYSTEISGNTLLVRLGTSQTAATVAAQATTTHFSPATAQNSDAPSPAQNAVSLSDLKNIDFRTAADGAGAVIVTLPSDQTSIDIRQQGSNVVVDLFQTTLPASLHRRLDVSDFRTPVQSISAEQVGANVRLTITPTGNWEQSAFQAGNQFVLEVHPVKEDPTRITGSTGYKGDRLTLNFQNIDVRAVLAVIAEFTEFNVVTSDSVQGSLTLRLKDVPWDQALDIILQAKGLAADRNGNVLWIAPRDEINNMRTERLRAAQEGEALEPLRTQVFQLNYAKSEAVMNALNPSSGTNSSATGSAPSLISERGTVIVDPRTNKLIVTDVPSRLENLAAVIAQIDIAVRQVVIEARIVDAEEGWGRSLGARLSGTGWSGNWGAGGTQPQDDDDDDDDDDDTSNDMTAKKDSWNMFNLAALSIGDKPGFFAVKFSPSAGKYLQLELQALESENYGRNIASPRLMTVDSVKASVEQGIEIPYQNATSSGATSVEFKKAVLLLEVTPQITPDGNVSMLINISQDTQGQDTLSGPSINTKRINTTVTVENGGTVVIGGIFQQSEKSTVRKIPLLGDLPLIGTFFRSNNKSTARSELLIFITPRVVNDGLTRSGSITPSMGSSL